MAVENRINDAIGIMSQIRTPAALFAGASLGSLFLVEITTLESSTLRLVYLFLTLISFATHLSAVFCTTILSWRLASGGFNPMFESANNLLTVHFEYDYLTVGAMFFGGIAFFILANTARAYLVFGYSLEAHLCALVNGICSFFLLEYLDVGIVSYDDFGVFLLRYLEMSVKHLISYRFSTTSIFYLVLIGLSTVTIASLSH